MSDQLTDIPNAVVSAYKLDSMAEGNQWFHGKSHGWLNISEKNWPKVKAGDTIVLFYRVPHERQGDKRLPFYHSEEILATIKKVGERRRDDIEFEGLDGKRYATKGWNVTAIKLRQMIPTIKEEKLL